MHIAENPFSGEPAALKDAAIMYSRTWWSGLLCSQNLGRLYSELRKWVGVYTPVRVSLVIGALIYGALWISLAGSLAADSHHVIVLKIDTSIQPAAAQYISRGLERAVAERAQLVIISVDTPGGLLSTTREIVTMLIESEIPTVTYVSPSGARAGSAGTFIVAAGHVAAMSPATNIGAASPVGPNGKELDRTVKKKVDSDAAAFIRSIAIARGRNADVLEKTVLETASYTAQEALENDVVEFIASDYAELLSELDGTAVNLGAGEIMLATENLSILTIEPNLLERFLFTVGNSNLVFILLAVGCIAVVIELLNPGIIFPGAIGVLCLAIALIGMGQLPPHWVGYGLIVASFGLIYMELQVPGVGLFALGGVLCFVLGSFLLSAGLSLPSMERTNFSLSLWAIGVVATLMLGSTFFTYRILVASKTGDVRSMVDNLVGQSGITRTALGPTGTVQVTGELWTAISDTGEHIAKGENVVVSEVSGNTLKVFKESEIST